MIRLHLGLAGVTAVVALLFLRDGQAWMGWTCVAGVAAILGLGIPGAKDAR